MNDQQSVRIRITIRGFDVFCVQVFNATGTLLGEVTYDADDFDGYVDLDSHDFDFILRPDGRPERIDQQ